MYKIVQGKLRRCSKAAEPNPASVQEIAAVLHPKMVEPRMPPPKVRVRFTQGELDKAAERIAPDKAPRLDCIPGRVVKTAVALAGSAYLVVFNKCLKSGRFPPRWKTARLVLIRKNVSL